MAQNMSLVMRVPSSYRTHRSGVVICCMEGHNPLSLQTAFSSSGRFNPTVLALDINKERIRKMFNNVELSVSSYDTAWVAMVPSPDSPKSPCFPECLNWLMDNQINDGSWGLVHNNPQLIKDTLSSTLACIVALKRWNVGEDQINKGLSFIESNFSSATDRNQPSPSGFDIIFPHMLKYAIDMNINLPLKQSDLSVMLHERKVILERSDWKEREAYLAYISEGLGEFYDWNMVKKYQMNNGSLFNSPSATAAAVIHHHNTGCLDYLRSLLKKFGNAVPTVYPLDLYLRLSMVDMLERLGITRYFQEEIQNVLDETYRSWVEKDEQIFNNVVTYALAFRVLRTNGYEVSSDSLAEVTKNADMNSHEETFEDVYAALEVYRASQVTYQDESAFKDQNMRSVDFLKRNLSTASDKLSPFMYTEVNNALTYPYNARFEIVSTKRNIEHYNANDTRILKTTYCSSNISNTDYLMLAVEDFNASQSIYRRELKDVQRWVVENQVDKLKFARQPTLYCYFSGVSAFPSPELSDARFAWAINSVLTTKIDDFFDVGGSIDELTNLTQCVEKWNVDVDNDCCSEEVRIIFLALKKAVAWIGDRAFKWQARDVTSHVIEIWLDLMKSMLREAIWAIDGCVPPIEEYIENGYVSFALGPIVLPSLYLIGPKLSEEIVQSSEYHDLFELLSTHGRLINDIRTLKRDLEAGQLNAVTLHKKYGKSAIEEKEIIEEIKMLSNNHEKKLMKLVLETKGSIVPRACKDPFWTMCNILNTFYGTDDGFTGTAILDIVHEVIDEPVSHKLLHMNTTTQEL